MHHGNKIRTIPTLSPNVSEMSPGVNINLVNKIIESLNEKIKNRKNPYYLFLNPNLKNFSEEIKEQPDIVFGALNYLVSYHSEYIKLKAILDVEEDGLFYILQDEDLEELSSKNTVHNPDDPRLVYRDAEKLVRRAFVLE